MGGAMFLAALLVLSIKYGFGFAAKKEKEEAPAVAEN
jgi:hypothetical protein